VKNYKQRFLELAARKAMMPDTVANRILMRKIDKVLDQYNEAKKHDANVQ
jgi:hypothetical protein